MSAPRSVASPIPLIAVILVALLVGAAAGGIAGWAAGSPSGAAPHVGQTAAPGAVGLDGQDGRDGADGLQGAAGQDGAPGAVGRDGRDGAPGPQGPAGPAGPPGAVGPAGPPGADASSFDFSFVRFLVSGEGLAFEGGPGQSIIVPLQLTGEYRVGNDAPAITPTANTVGSALTGQGAGLYRWNVVMTSVETELFAQRQLRFVVAGAGVDPQLIELEPQVTGTWGASTSVVEIQATVFVELADGAELVAVYTSDAGITSVTGGAVTFERVG